MKHKYILFLLLILPLNLNILSQDCSVTFKISGERADGNGTWESEMEAVQVCKDFPDDEKSKQDADWKSYYGEGYTMIGSSTKKQDCAGYTFEKIFGHGPLVINAGRFHDHLLVWFGKRINTGIGWGDVQPGDVLVYGAAGHITYVKKVNTTLGVVSSVVIDTKNGNEPLFEHEISITESGNDPLRQRFGQIYVYRLDLSKINVTKVSSPCNCENKLNFTGNWGTRYGVITMTQSGTSVSGTYPNGSLQGTVSEEDGALVCKGKWDEGSKSGDFVFKMYVPEKYEGIYNKKEDPGFWYIDWGGTRK